MAVAILAGLVVSATTLQFGAFNGEPDALARQGGGEATAGLHALQDAGIGDGALTPIQVLMRGGDPDAVAVKLAQVPGVHAAAAALILFLTFVAMGSGPEVDVKVLATGLAAGILLDATLIRALLVPAVISLFGRWNWWLPRPAARVLRVSQSPT